FHADAFLLEHGFFILKSPMAQSGVNNEYFLHHRRRGRRTLRCGLLRAPHLNKTVRRDLWQSDPGASDRFRAPISDFALAAGNEGSRILSLPLPDSTWIARRVWSKWPDMACGRRFRAEQHSYHRKYRDQNNQPLTDPLHVRRHRQHFNDIKEDDCGYSQLRSIDDHRDHVHWKPPQSGAIAILELAEQNQNQNDNKHEAKAAAAIIASPIKRAATKPAKAAKQCDDENDQDNCSKRHEAVSVCLAPISLRRRIQNAMVVCCRRRLRRGTNLCTSRSENFTAT